MPVSFRDVSYIYAPKTPFSYCALKDVTFTIEEGSFIAIVGKTGSGKSTIAQLTNALLTPSEGEIRVNEFVNASHVKKKRKDIKKLRKEVGLVFQFPEYQLFEETVEKDVAFGPRNFGLSKEEALKKAHEALLTLGLDESFFTRSPFELSGGEKRKVALAGILAIEPKVLLIDEPTSGLDPRAAEETMDLFRRINREKKVTVIFVSHDMDLVLEYADRVIVVDNGSIQRICAPQELFGSDLSVYSLDNPKVFDFALRLKERGFDVDFSKLRTVDDLGKAIADRSKR